MARPSHLRPVPDMVDAQNTNENIRINEGNRLIALLDGVTTPVRGLDDQHYVTLDSSPHLALVHDGANSPAMQIISQLSFSETLRWPAANAKSLAADYLSAQCMVTQPKDVSLRAAFASGCIYLDTAWPSNEVILISDKGVQVVDTCSEVFIRSGVTGQLPVLGAVGADIMRLLHYVRIPTLGLPALLACLISTWLTNQAQPLVLIQGPAAAGKTTALRFLLDLVDPSTSTAGGSLTSNEREMRALSRVRRTLVFDNVSWIKGDASDLLAKITTGSEMITRALYQNSSPDVMQLKRPVFLNGILNGFNRSDLASRTVGFELSPIPTEQRLEDGQLELNWQQELPGLFRALTELASHVLAELPTAEAVKTNYRNPLLVKITQIISKKLGLDGISYLERSVADLSISVLGGTAMGQAFTELHRCYTCHEEAHCNMTFLERVLGKFVRADEIRNVLLVHLDESEHHNLPAINRNFGEALQRIESDLESVLKLKITKKRDSHGMLYKVEF